YEQGDAARAVDSFQKAVALQPTHPDALLNLANACLLAGRSEDAAKFAQQVLSMDPQSAAAYYIAGCANLPLRSFQEAISPLQQSNDIDAKLNAVSLKLGPAHNMLGPLGVLDINQLGANDHFLG